MALKDIIGQEKAIAMLQGILKRDRLAGAYLFCGESGTGKKTAAINFAKAVNCLKAGHGHNDDQGGLLPIVLPDQVPQFDACESCESCLKINAGTHPDILTIVPEDRMIRIGEKGEENTIRFIEEALAFRPFEGKMKVIIVDDADLMNQQAANAFLKTLEEPPHDSLIMLISARPDRLPATIRSRCSKVPFNSLSRSACSSILKDKMMPDVYADQAARLSLGRPGLALSSDVKEERDWFLNLFNAMMRAEKDSWASREEIEKWFDLAMIFLRDITVYKITGSTSGLINADIPDMIGKLGKSADIRRIIDIHKEMGKIKFMLLFNLNKSLTWNYTSSLLRKELYSYNG